MEKLLTVEEVAKMLSVDRETVYRWIKAGKLIASQPGGYIWRIRPQDLEAFVSKPL